MGSLQSPSASSSESCPDAEQQTGRRLWVGNIAWAVSSQDLWRHFQTQGRVVYASVMRDAEQRSRGWGIVVFHAPEEAERALAEFNGAEFCGRHLTLRLDRQGQKGKGRSSRQSSGETSPEQPSPLPPPSPAAPEPQPAAGEQEAPPRQEQHGPSAQPPSGPGAEQPAEPAGEAQQPLEGEEQLLEARAESTEVDKASSSPPLELAAEQPSSSGYQVVVYGLPWALTDAQLAHIFQGVGVVEAATVVRSSTGTSQGWGTVRFSAREAAQLAVQEFNKAQVDGEEIIVKLDTRGAQ